MQIEVQERHSGRSAKNRQPAGPAQAATAAKLASLREISPGNPPTPSAQRSPSSASSTHSMLGVLMVSPRKIPSIRLSPLVRRNTLGIGQRGVWLARRSTARGDSASMPCAASPPSTFCHDQVTTSSRSQGRSIAKAAEVASQIARPSRSEAIQPGSRIRTPDVVPFQVKTTSRRQSTWPRSGRAP